VGFGGLAVMYLELNGVAFLSKSLTSRIMRLSMLDTVPDIFSVLETFIIILGQTYYSNTLVSEVMEFPFNM
jgi:hypothetical protein